jgi:hypothetical protein
VIYTGEDQCSTVRIGTEKGGAMLTPIEQLPDDMELTTAEAAPYCYAKPGTLDKWRAAGRGPAYVAYGDGPKPRIKYLVGDLKTWRATGQRRRIVPGEEGETPAQVA